MNKNEKIRSFPNAALFIDMEWRNSFGQVGPALDEDFSVTAQPYVSLTVDTPHLDEDAAIHAALSVFDSYARDKKGTLYWRTAPTIERIRQGRYWGYRIRLQLLISDNPLVPRLVSKAVPHFMELPI